ncbi:MAG: PDZ domain-containing protein [Cytophagaceae bacterium]|nr:PDZ domain-containing protein [Cytophagaceae bacterium]MDW8455154.1 PDZ domain-containing protein [Cytophagaceae bacterium]
MNYIFRKLPEQRHVLHITFVIDNCTEDKLFLQLPAWRPGRYELQNYAANIYSVAAFDEYYSPLVVEKTSRNNWVVKKGNRKKVYIEYQYYAAHMDAGGCWVDEHQWYINFICCCLYIPERINEPCEVVCELPAKYDIACGMPEEHNVLFAKDFYHLFDSPMMASAHLIHASFVAMDVKFHLHIQGNNFLSLNNVLSDLERVAKEQISIFGEFPEKEYHFLFQFLPYPLYHGVEHRNSTVIVLGPSEEILYEELLSISSHELFHAWNIVKIRPAELYPYDFSKENYFKTGFVAEGFTTYYGDLMLFRSGVYTDYAYFTRFNNILKRHFETKGMSLIDSSFDLWIDGYRDIAPNRKVSIYTKGCVAAFLFDIEIRRKNNNALSLDTIMLSLWNNFGKMNKGYTLDDVTNLLVDAGLEKTYINEVLCGTTDLKEKIERALDYIGYELSVIPAQNQCEHKFGLRFTLKDNKIIVDGIASGSPAEKAGLTKGDEIIAINNRKASMVNVNLLFQMVDHANICFFSNGILEYCRLEPGEETYFEQKTARKKSDADTNQKMNYLSWSKNTF